MAKRILVSQGSRHAAVGSFNRTPLNRNRDGDRAMGNEVLKAADDFVKATWPEGINGVDSEPTYIGVDDITLNGKPLTDERILSLVETDAEMDDPDEEDHDAGLKVLEDELEDTLQMDVEQQVKSEMQGRDLKRHSEGDISKVRK